jgi:hypothetical protein
MAARDPLLHGWGRLALRAVDSPLPQLERGADGSPTEDSLRKAATEAGGTFELRSRSILVLIDLRTFRPWPTGHPWNAAVREHALAEIAELLPGLRPDDPATVASELDAALTLYAAVRCGGAASRRSESWVSASELPAWDWWRH